MGKGPREKRPLSGQTIQVGGSDMVIAVAAEPVSPERIDGDEEDIPPLIGPSGMDGGGPEQSPAQGKAENDPNEKSSFFHGRRTRLDLIDTAEILLLV
jgi:hypothetical protein